MHNPSKPHTLAISRTEPRRLVVPMALAGCRVIVETDIGERFCALEVAADGTVELPCRPDADARRAFVRLAAEAA